MQAYGWVCFEDMLDTEWRTAPPQKGNYFTFSLRLDTRRIPPAIIKKQLSLALKAEKEKMQAQGKKFISRERKKDLKEQVLLRLRQRFLPTPAEFNVVWEPDHNEVWFASTQGKMIDLFMEAFLNTFELHLEQIEPYSLAEGLLDDVDMGKLDRSESTRFTGEPGSDGLMLGNVLGEEFLTTWRQAPSWTRMASLSLFPWSSASSFKEAKGRPRRPPVSPVRSPRSQRPASAWARAKK